MKTTLITVGIVASLVLGVANFGKPVQVSVNPTPIQVNVPEQGAPVVNVQAPNVSVPTTVNVPKQESSSFGSVTGPESYFPVYNENGVLRVPRAIAYNAASTTIFAFKPGASTGATTTLDTELSRCRFIVASSSVATTLTISKATTAFATTTIIATSSIAANAQASLKIASTSGMTTQAVMAQYFADLTFGPSDWLVGSLAGGTGTFSPTGSCAVGFWGLK